MEAVARAGGRGRAQHLDLDVGQRLVDVGPGLVGVVDELAVLVGHLRGQRQEHLLHGELDGRAGLGLRDRQTVDADLDLDDVLDAVLLAVLELALLHGARGVGQVGVGLADAGAEELHAAAGAGRLDDRRLAGAGLAELLGNGRGERIDGRGANDPDLVACRRRIGHRDQSRDGRSRRDGYELAVHACSPWLDRRPADRLSRTQHRAIDEALLAVARNANVTYQHIEIAVCSMNCCRCESVVFAAPPEHRASRRWACRRWRLSCPGHPARCAIDLPGARCSTRRIASQGSERR